ncbi:MAG: DUF4474 domain-containing protein [Clostridia bacterium]|nr:DUF4474 domain-containing protein [Clostridia bacterium]
MKNKIIAMLLVIVTLFSVAAVPVGAAAEKKSKIDIIDIWQNGYPMFNIGSFLETIFLVNEQINTIAGVKIFNEEKLVVVADDVLSGVVEGVLETTGVDFSQIYTNLPQTNQYAELVTSSLNLNIPETQKYLNDLSNQYYLEGNMAMCVVVRMVSVWLGIVDEVLLLAAPVEGKPGLYELGIEITYRDGSKDRVYAGIYYDENTNSFVGKDGAPAFLGYYMDFNQNMIYTGIDVWQRELGFNIFYDVFCYLTPFFFHYTTQRIKFDYDGREWMIQLWKGRYAIANGGEVGIYTREAERDGSFYDCAADEDMLVMSIELYHGDKLLFSREPTLHWWVTGFVLSDTAYLPHSLTLISTITMKDAEMLEAVTASIDKKLGLIKYEVDGLDVTITW